MHRHSHRGIDSDPSKLSLEPYTLGIIWCRRQRTEWCATLRTAVVMIIMEITNTPALRALVGITPSGNCIDDLVPNNDLPQLVGQIIFRTSAQLPPSLCIGEKSVKP